MNKLVGLAFACVATGALCAATAVTAFAQNPPSASPEPTATQNVIGGDLMVGVPVGDLADAAGIGIGALVRFEHTLNPTMAVTGRAGFIYHLEKNGATLSQIPLLGGIKYFLGTGPQRPYLRAEAGLDILRVSVDFGGMTFSDSETKVGVNVGGGFDMGQIKVEGTIFIPSIGDVDDGFMIAGTVGYDFTAL